MINGIIKLIIGNKDAIKSGFNAIFPKAGKTKVGRFFKGVINGGSHATPITFFKSFLIDFIDSDADGKITVKDFKDVSIETLGKALGFILVIGLLYYLFSVHLGINF